MIRFGSSITTIFTFQEGVGLTSLCYRGEELCFLLGSLPCLSLWASPHGRKNGK